MCDEATLVVQESEMSQPQSEEAAVVIEDQIPIIVESASSTSSVDSEQRPKMKPMPIVPAVDAEKEMKKGVERKRKSEYVPMTNLENEPECWMDQQERPHEEEESKPPPGRLQRLARKAGIILGGGTLTAVGTFLLFVPAPTPSIYMMIGGMAVLAKEFPAAQRQLDSSRESLMSALDRAAQEDAKIAAALEAQVQHVGEIQLSLDKKKANNNNNNENNDDEDQEGAETDGFSSDEDEEVKQLQPPTSPASAKKSEPTVAPAVPSVVQKSAVQRHFENVGRNVILPLLNKVCTPMGEEGTTLTATVTAETTTNATLPQYAQTLSPRGVSSFDDEDDNEDESGKENAAPPPAEVLGPFARFALYRANLRAQRLKAEEQREREAMLRRINEANLQQCHEDAVVTDIATTMDLSAAVSTDSIAAA
eukprot:scaffold755_cov101-Cylindrotheca_fusiformis.AAC.6